MQGLAGSRVSRSGLPEGEILGELHGSAWTESELETLLASYRGMLHAEIAGEPYVKRRFNDEVQTATGRSRAAIEFKFCNLSAVLMDLGRAHVPGYKPRRHYQRDMLDVVSHRLDSFATLADWQFPEATLEVDDEGSSVGANREAVDAYGRASIATSGVNATIDEFVPQKGTVSPGSGGTVPVVDDWNVLAALWDRATGGRDVADRPLPRETEAEGHSSSGMAGVVAPRPAGVTEACSWFNTDRDISVQPKFLFLIGAPGAGKSHATKDLVFGLERTSPEEDDLAHRLYVYETSGRAIALVNDATIPSDNFSTAPLSQEIEQCLTEDRHLVACVNRGILVEESRALSSLDEQLPSSKLLIEWLQMQGGGPETLTHDNWNIEEESKSHYLLTGWLTRNGQRAAEITAVFVDVCSLLERTPAVQKPSNGHLVPSPYVVGNFLERLSWEDDETSAGALLCQILDVLDAGEMVRGGCSVNPILANLQSLRSRKVRSGLLATLRAAEIAKGQRFSYREIWGALVRAIVGDLPEKGSPELLRPYFEPYNQAYQGQGSHEFESLIELAHLRFSQAIFGVSNFDRSDETDPRSNPITRLTSWVDPMRDARPGAYDSKPIDGWASIVTEAFAGTDVDESPLRVIADEAKRSGDAVVDEVLTDFDWEVDESYRRVMSNPETPEADRRLFMHWYGAYLGRLYALVHGISAFRPEICNWTEASMLSPNVPPELQEGLRALLRPKRIPNDMSSASLIPVLDSRTTPIVGSVDQAKIALQTGNFEMHIDAKAESIFLVLSEGSAEVARMPLDLALIREARACALEHPGLTELTDTTSPRLERFRAARLVPDQLTTDHYRIVHGDTASVLVVNPGVGSQARG